MAQNYPLVFRYRDLVKGAGFTASVVVDGRAVLAEEDDGDTWVFGVQPGAIAGGIAGGEADAYARPDLACAEFKQNYRNVLLDIAAEAASFEAFKAGVTQFFAQADESEAQEWAAALATKGVLAGFARTSAVPPKIEIVQVEGDPLPSAHLDGPALAGEA